MAKAAGFPPAKLLGPAVLLAIVCGLTPAFGAGVAIEDTFRTAIGLTKFNGVVTISAPNMTTASGETILRWSADFAVVNGVVQGTSGIVLEPNDTATPEGTSYLVRYTPSPAARGQSWSEVWIVPTSATALKISQVRQISAPTPGIAVAQSQVAGLIAALAGKVGTTRQVNGHALSSDVIVTKGDVGLGNADNTADADKPVSGPQQTALDGKVGRNANGGLTVNGPTGASDVQSFEIVNSPNGLNWIPVPTFYPTKDNSPIALDVSPKGNPVDSTYGKAWFDICNTDQMTSGLFPTQCIHMGAGEDVLNIASVIYSGGTPLPLRFSQFDGDNGIFIGGLQIETDGGVTFPALTGEATRCAQLTAAGELEAASGACGSGGGGSVNVNGSSVSDPNFNGTTPAAETGYTNAKLQVSGSSVSVEVPTVTKTTLGLGNVDNTSDANKPISSATQAALDAKQATITGAPGTWPSFATVATSGAYADLSGKPTLGDAAAKNVGTGAGDVAAGDDARMNNARTPTAHAASHGSGQADAITIAESQVTNLATDLAAKLGLHAKADTAGAADTAAALTAQYIDWNSGSGGESIKNKPTLTDVVISKTFDGGGFAITAGSAGYYKATQACTLTGWTILSTSGTAVVDIWKIAAGTALPTVADSITNGSPPTLSANQVSTGTMAGWTTAAVAVGDIFGFSFTSGTSPYATVQLTCGR